MKKIVVSLFDGGSTGQLALTQEGITYDRYIASEVDIPAIKVATKNFPNTYHIGDVQKIDTKSLGNVWLLLGGSPCTDFTICGKSKGMVDVYQNKILSLEQYLNLKSQGWKFDGQSYLFWEYLRILRETKPKYFLLENVIMKPEWEDLITKELGVSPIRINSSKLSGQNRDRIYWTNIPNTSIPDDQGIHISNIIPDAIGGYGIRGKWCNTNKKYIPVGTTRKDGKSNCILASKGGTLKVTLKDNTNRNLTVNEAELLQTLPLDYTNVKGLSDTKRLHVIGNGWTTKVIRHLFSGLKQVA